MLSYRQGHAEVEAHLAGFPSMFHIQLHQASNKLSRLNLSEAELMIGILERWARGEKVEIGEFVWSADEAKITVIEGPEVPIGGMTLGRGWPTALRKGRDVTVEALAEARRRVAEAAKASQVAAAQTQTAGAGHAVGAGHAAGAGGGAGAGGAAAGGGAADLALLADSLGLELLRRLAEAEMPLQGVWRLASERHPEMGPSGALEVAAAAVASLANSGLVAVVRGAAEESLTPQELEPALADVGSWSASDPAEALRIRRV